MKATLVRLLALATCASCAPHAALAATPAPVSITVDVAAAGKPISPDLFGIFFEDLNYAADGGLYAELVQNRSFEYDASEQLDWNSWSKWATASRGGGAGSVGIRTAKPLNTNNPHYVSIEAKSPGDGFGISNDGYDGIPVAANETYHLSFFAQQLFMGEPWTLDNDIVNRPMPVTVRLETQGGDVLAESAITISGREWTRYTANLNPSRTDPKARLVLLVRSKGGIAVDEISLMPEQTFHLRKNGLRRDLAQTIADLKPKFVRFPGGCLAHGDGVNNFYRWKDTLGPVEQRRGQRNLWGYHQSVGLGYFEFFQFCEDIGARPLPVLPAAVSCQNTNFSPGHGQQCVPLQDMDAYIQDVLDLIEWANGPVTSTWGARRAEAGHPAPFGLKYLGIGNEDNITPDFEQRFRLIQNAVKARHPEIVIIGTVGPAPDGEDFEKGWAFARAQGVATVDEHFYRSPDWFWNNLHRYDAYDRHGPAVYVGEYAAHEPDRRNTLRSALAEAAGGLGFEKNGDIVRLASYAPLLARRGFTQWTPDMIYFTGTQIYRTLNYEVQRLLGENSGDRLLPSSVTPAVEGKRFALSAVRDTASNHVIIKIVNDEDSEVATSLSLGASLGKPLQLVTTVLSASSADVANEDGKAPAAVPLTTERSVGATFEVAVPAHSFVVLRLK